MIHLEDLMVGDWVYDAVLKKAIILNNLPYGIDLSNREGIPVTKEILEKIGFKEDTALVKFYRYWEKGDKYKLDVDEGYTNSGRMWSVHIDNDVCNTIGSGEFDYVHELQNLVRINCKADLPITKEVFDGLGDES